MNFTPKQKELMETWKRGELARLNLLEGSVSSGKTWVSLILWAFWVATMPMDGIYLMCAKSLTTLKRNCLLLLQEQIGRSNFTFSIQSKEGYLFGRYVVFEGANDARSESKIRGLTLQGAYCDELTQLPEDFFAMLLSRLRMPGAKLIATTNPDNPMHWLKTDYIDRQDELDFLDIVFTIDDNTELDPEYVRSIKKEYTGVFYERFILGCWVAAEGLVYPMFSEAEHVIDEIPWQAIQRGRWYVSIDYGTVNPCAMELWTIYNGVAYLVKESYYDSRQPGHIQRTDEEHYAELERLIGDRKIDKIIIDPSAASFKATIRKHGKFSVWDAQNDVINGIRFTATALKSGRIKIHSSCVDCIREFKSYMWDSDATEDAVIKENDHAADSVRYLSYTVLSRYVG